MTRVLVGWRDHGVRAILALALTLGALGFVGARWDSGQPAPEPPSVAWRRTAQGWETMSIRPPRVMARPLAALNPVSVAALQLLAVVLLAAVHDLQSFRAESRTDLAAAGH